MILVVHGIGQQAAITQESLNSVYDANTLRKEVQRHAEGPVMRGLMGSGQVQVLPVQWRHKFRLRYSDELDQENREHRLYNTYDLEDVTLRNSIPWVPLAVSLSLIWLVRLLTDI